MPASAEGAPARKRDYRKLWGRFVSLKCPLRSGPGGLDPLIGGALTAYSTIALTRQRPRMEAMTMEMT